MHYTHDLPTSPGYYWYKKYPSVKAEIVQIIEYGRDAVLLQSGWSLKHWTMDGKAQWSSESIPEPNE